MQAARLARARRLGLDPDEASEQLLDAMRGDLLGEWLPLALADLVCAWTGDSRKSVLASWGFKRTQADIDAETDRTLEQFFNISR